MGVEIWENRVTEKELNKMGSLLIYSFHGSLLISNG